MKRLIKAVIFSVLSVYCCLTLQVSTIAFAEDCVTEPTEAITDEYVTEPTESTEAITNEYDISCSYSEIAELEKEIAELEKRIAELKEQKRKVQVVLVAMVILFGIIFFINLIFF